MEDMVEMLKDRLADAEEKAMRPQEPLQAMSSGEIPAGLTLEAAWSKIAIQQDNNRALRQALEDTVEAKESEITLLHSMMKSTRKVFSEGLRQAKKQQTQPQPQNQPHSQHTQQQQRQHNSNSNTETETPSMKIQCTRQLVGSLQLHHAIPAHHEIDYYNG